MPTMSRPSKKARAIIAISVVLAVALGLFLYLNYATSGFLDWQGDADLSSRMSYKNYKDATYLINGKLAKLDNGVSVIDNDKYGLSQTVTLYFGEDVMGDLDGDGKPDVAFIVTQNGKENAKGDDNVGDTLYYAVAAIKTAKGYVGTNGVLLGDGIAPQDLEIKNGIITAIYKDRQIGDPMSAAPSMIARTARS